MDKVDSITDTEEGIRIIYTLTNCTNVNNNQFSWIHLFVLKC